MIQLQYIKIIKILLHIITYLAIGLDAVLEAVKLPASIADLDSGLGKREKLLAGLGHFQWTWTRQRNY